MFLFIEGAFYLGQEEVVSNQKSAIDKCGKEVNGLDDHKGHSVSCFFGWDYSKNFIRLP